MNADEKLNHKGHKGHEGFHFDCLPVQLQGARQAGDSLFFVAFFLGVLGGSKHR